MNSTRIENPALPVLTLVEVKRHLRIDSAADDETLMQLISGATDFLERDCNLALVNQTWRFYLDTLPRNQVTTIALSNAHSIVGITTYDDKGVPHQLAATNYFLNTISCPARLRFLAGFDPEKAVNGVEIDVRAGFGDTGADVPNSIKQALLALIAHWYEFRHAFAPADQPVSVPEAYSRLMRSWRIVRL